MMKKNCSEHSSVVIVMIKQGQSGKRFRELMVLAHSHDVISWSCMAKHLGFGFNDAVNQTLSSTI